MKTAVRKCDWCGIEEHEPTIGWYELGYSSLLQTDETDTEPRDFHSFRCIFEYAQLKLAEEARIKNRS